MTLLIFLINIIITFWFKEQGFCKSESIKFHEVIQDLI